MRYQSIYLMTPNYVIQASYLVLFLRNLKKEITIKALIEFLLIGAPRVVQCVVCPERQIVEQTSVYLLAG